MLVEHVQARRWQPHGGCQPAEQVLGGSRRKNKGKVYTHEKLGGRKWSTFLHMKMWSGQKVGSLTHENVKLECVFHEDPSDSVFPLKSVSECVKLTHVRDLGARFPATSWLQLVPNARKRTGEQLGLFAGEKTHTAQRRPTRGLRKQNGEGA